MDKTRLSIITINWNNAEGLRKTVESVTCQQCSEFEYIIVDGGSTDGSVDVIRHFDGSSVRLRWVSEKDKGIYNAMNKGIMMANGEYLQFLNSGDTLIDSSVISNILNEIECHNNPDIVIGGVLKIQDGKIRRFTQLQDEIGFWRFYNGSLPHPSSFIRKSLFEKYGMYDENLRIVSDWKWFMRVVVFEGVTPIFVRLDVALFDMGGISETNTALRNNERRKVLEEMVHPNILADYRRYNADIRIMRRIRRHKCAFKLVSCIERVLFKIEKLKNNKRY